MRYRSADMVNLSFLEFYLEIILSYFRPLKVKKVFEVDEI